MADNNRISDLFNVVHESLRGTVGKKKLFITHFTGRKCPQKKIAVYFSP